MNRRSHPCWASLLSIATLTLACRAGTPVTPATLEPSSPASVTLPATEEEMRSLTALYRNHLTTIANPFFEGRAPGTDGNRLAAQYIEFQLRRLGLEPAFPTETKDAEGKVVESRPRSNYRQVFTAPPSLRPGDSTKIVSQAVSFDVGGTIAAFKPDVDYKVLGYSGSGDVTGEIAFVGYATRSDDKGYDTFFGGAKVEGKIAMVLRFEPMDEKGKSRWGASGAWTTAAALDSKLRAVERAGAAAIILVNPPGADDPRATKLEGLELSGARGNSSKVPVIMMSQDAADRLVKAADESGRGLRDLREQADTLAKETAGIIALPKARATVKVGVERVPLLTDNVGAILPGKGALAEEFIVIGSHYDHVGYGYFGSRDPDPRGKIHAGADDNGSGTSGNLLTAERFVKAYAALAEGAQARSILFLWFSAEESGLVGSRHYVKHPIVPIEKHAMMLNMDMIGRLREGKMELGGVGTAEGFEAWLQPYVDSSGLKIKQTKSGFGPSDHASFTGVKVPTLFFFTQLHKEYHTPADVVDTINFDGAVQVADLAFRIGFDAARRPEPFVFSNGEPKADAPVDDKKDEGKKDDPAQENRPGNVGGVAVGVRFGIAPGDYAGEEPGVLVGEVFPDLPAAKAGLKEGDLMTKWNDTELKDVAGWMPLLSKAKPGDVVKITYRRKTDGAMKEFTTECTLVARAPKAQQ
ncbi:MAG: M28 family peptidase [Phycisphaerae bacterium]